MKLKLFRRLSGMLFAFLAILFYQNCGGGFKTLESSTSGLSSITSNPGGPSQSPPVIPVPSLTPGPTATPTPTSTPVGTIPAGKAQVFVAQGHVGRTLMSCDGGKTWIHDINDDSTARCYNPTECDHASFSGAGIDFNDGWFFASYGHGSLGTLRRSKDGFNWEKIKAGYPDGGISFVNGILVWMNGQFGLSLDLGVTVNDNNSHVPGGYFLARTLARTNDGVLVVSGDDPGGLYSQDSGKTWNNVTLNGATWGRNVLLAKDKNGMIVSVSAVHAQTASGGFVTSAYSARSMDNGKTWSGQTLYSGEDYADWAGFYYDGSQFVGWYDNKMWKSADGLNWSTMNVANQNITSGPISRSPAGEFVAIPNIWDNYYEKQKAYRSTDGLNWTLLDANHFTGGHPILRIISGYVDAAVCQ